MCRARTDILFPYPGPVEVEDRDEAGSVMTPTGTGRPSAPNLLSKRGLYEVDLVGVGGGLS